MEQTKTQNVKIPQTFSPAYDIPLPPFSSCSLFNHCDVCEDDVDDYGGTGDNDGGGDGVGDDGSDDGDGWFWNDDVGTWRLYTLP